MSLTPLRIRLPYGSEAEFIERYGANVSRGGVFIATRALRPDATGISFEFVLKDGSRLLRGEGVVQVAPAGEGEARAGMTVRFTRLDSRSKALIDRILAARSGLGEAQPPAVVEAAQPPTSAAQPQPARPAPIAAGAAGPGDSPVPPPFEALLAQAEPESGRAPSPAGEPEAAKRSTRPPGTKGETPGPDRGVSARSKATPEVVLGIDLGTTNSRVAVARDGTARLIPLGSDGRTLAIPSVVSLDEKGRFLVGARAKAQILVDPGNTVYGAKRLMGQRARSRKVREMTQRFAYTVVPDMNGDAGVELGGRVYSLSELAAMLLGELKDAAQNYLGHEVSRAVLCVPAYFSDHQRAAMLEAGRLAGLTVERLVNEPSAVALAFGHGRGLARKRILVYDLGGGTFDASVVELTGDDLEVVTTGGDNFLGGLDFDVRLARQLIDTLPEDVRSKLDESSLAAQRVLDAAEQAKIALSDVDSFQVRVPFALHRPDGSPVDLDAAVTRAGLEAATADLVERTLEVTRMVLDAGALKPGGLDEVLLVGGQSRAPLVRRRLEEVFGRVIRAEVDPHSAVAVGAALLGDSLLQRQQGKTGASLSEVLSMPIGIGVRGGGMSRVLEKNTRLPTVKTISVPVQANQPIGIAVFQGTSAVAEENDYLGSLQTSSDRGGELTVKFAVSPDGRLDLTAAGPTGRKVAVTVATADASDETIAKLLAEAPLPGQAPDSPSGLFRGLRKLLGKSQQ